jgi:hypothetical protein
LDPTRFFNKEQNQMSSRDIVIFGYDDDPEVVEFQQLTIDPKLDIDFALKDAIEKLDKKNKGGFKVEPHDSWYRDHQYVPIYVSTYDGSIYSESRQRYEEDARSFIVSEGGGYIYDLKAKSAEHVFVPSWETRDKASNTEEAMQYIASYMAQNFAGLGSNAKEIEAYAAKFGIPFSADLIGQFRAEFDLHQSQWDSSSAYC